MITTDRLETLGQLPPISAEQSMEIYYDRMQHLDYETRIAKLSPEAFARELFILANIHYRPMDEVFIGRLAIIRIVGETIAAVHEPMTAAYWLNRGLNGSKMVTRRAYILGSNEAVASSPSSQITDELERFFF